MNDEITVMIDGAGDIEAALIAYVNRVTSDLHTRALQAGDNVLNESQTLVPVSDQDGQHLKDTGIVIDGTSGDLIQVDVRYGDPGQSYGDKYGEQDGYSWFVENGHLDRAGKPVEPQPYLAPPFDSEAQRLDGDIPGILSA